MTSILDKPAVRKAALPISVAQYHRLGELGIIAENTELLRGVIIEKMIKSPKHSWIVASLVDWLRANLGSSFHVRQEQPLTLADSEPEPDVAVVAGGVDDFRHQHPTTAKLVIEVALSSEELDREKVGIYAEADVDEYWIILADQRQVEVYTQPSASGYARMHCHQCNEVITATVLPVLTLPLGRILS